MFNQLSTSILVVRADESPGVSYSVFVNCDPNNNLLRFELSGESETVIGISIAIEDVILKQVQSSDPELFSVKKCIINNVQIKSWPAKVYRYKRHEANLYVCDGNLYYRGPSVVPVISFKIMLDLAMFTHCNFGNIRQNKLLGIVSDSASHPSIYEIISELCTTCPKCQLYKVSSSTVIPPTLKIHTTYPFELMAADLISLPPNQGFIGCLVAVDHYSKWVTAVPIRNKKSASIIQVFNTQIFSSHSKNPCQMMTVMTDNGAEFMSDDFKSFLNSLSKSHQLSTPYHPSSNGVVERVNRTIQNLIKSLTDCNTNWLEHLPRALIIYNNTIHSELNPSPAKFLLSNRHIYGGIPGSN